MNSHAYIRVRCNKAYLTDIREFVKARLEELEVEGRTSDQIVLAVDEACANCMIHQHHCDNYSTIDVAVFRENGTLYAEIRDTGKAFPIHQYQPKDLEEIMKLRAKGGLGINLIHRIMDEIAIEETEEHSIYRFGKKLK